MQFPPPCPDGSFAIHRIRIPGFKSKVSAYYEADGRLADAEFINIFGHSRPVESLKAREYLSRLGQRYKQPNPPSP